MQITIFGANGKVGRKVVAKLLEQGHLVVAFVHSESRLTPNPHLNIIQGDVRSASDVSAALKGSDAVISTMGSWGTKSKDILEKGMEVIIPAMESAKIKRIISLTGGDARDKQDKPQILNTLSHFSLSLLAPKILRDGEKHIALLRASSLDWTVLRSPVMLKKLKPGFRIQSTPLKPWAVITRDDVANALVKLAVNNYFNKSSPFIARS